MQTAISWRTRDRRSGGGSDDFPEGPDIPNGPVELGDGAKNGPRKFYVDGGEFLIVRHLVYELDFDGRQLAYRQLTDYAGDKVRTLYPNASELRTDRLDPERLVKIVERLEEKGMDLDSLADAVGKPEIDPFDLLCHLAYNAPLRIQRERADRLVREQDEFLGRFGPNAREVLDAVLEKYTEHGIAQFKLSDILEVPLVQRVGQRHRKRRPLRRRQGAAQRRRRAVASTLHHLN